MTKIRVPDWRAAPTKVGRKLNFSSEDGANILAERIMVAWRRAGHTNVYAWPVRIQVPNDGKREPYYAVRTNLVGGLPPGGREKANPD